MSSIVHFEIPADDIKRAKNFYTELFGWKIEKFQCEEGCENAGMENMEYWSITTTNEQNEQGLCGGMMKRQNPHQPITNYIDVPSVAEHTKKIESLGGKVIVPRTAVSNMGYFAVFLDSESNVFGIWENNTNAK